MHDETGWAAGWEVMTDGGVATVQLFGDMDLATEDRLIMGVDSLFSTGCSSVVVDLGGVEFIDSSGIRALLRIRGRHGDRVAVGVVSEPVRRLFDIAGVGTLLSADPLDGSSDGGGVSSVGESS